MSALQLLEWATHYIKARDSIERKLKSLDSQSDKLVAHYKDREVTFLAMEKLASTGLESGAITVVTLQTRANFDVLVGDFASFAKNPLLTIIFVNPKANEKWLIKPAVHASVADKSSLKTGLQAMFETVPTL